MQMRFAFVFAPLDVTTRGPHSPRTVGDFVLGPQLLAYVNCGHGMWVTLLGSRIPIGHCL